MDQTDTNTALAFEGVGASENRPAPPLSPNRYGVAARNFDRTKTIADAERESLERSLVQRAQAGEDGAFAALFELHKKRVYSVCLLMTKDSAEAEDLTQEAFLQVFRCIRTFRGEAAFSTWLRRVVLNTVLMKLRRQKSRVMVSLSETASDESSPLSHEIATPDPRLSRTVDRIALLRAIECLPDGCRRVFSLYEIEGYRHREIARLLHCTIGNSKSQLYKAKLKMRDLLFPKRRVLRRRGGLRISEPATGFAPSRLQGQPAAR
ncbi:MAG TPA: RNA polymerase sigma factor [Candidatus Binatia bacterium]|nr:RNA polymerase sigma factor [Candidatus Binatia bacterium]